MDDENNSQWICDRCENPVEENSTHCAECGALFDHTAFCFWHHSSEALGFCVLCSQPYCQRCGGWVAERFLCVRHAGYEIIENMANVYEDLDYLRAGSVSGFLEQAGLHPFLFGRSSSHFPSAVDIISKSPLYIPGQHNTEKLKIFVSFNEVTKTEEVLKELDFLPNHKV
jgi:hypothetical protein